MEKKKNKSKTPVRSYLNYISEESKHRAEEGSLRASDNTFTSESPLKKDWDSSEHSLHSAGKKSKPHFHDYLQSTEGDNSTILSTLNAQNKALHKELNNCRAKNYELDVEVYILKESLASKTNELHKLAMELDSYRNSERSLKSYKEEYNALKEELINNKMIFEGRMKKSQQRNEELMKIISENNETISQMKLKEKKDPEDFLMRRGRSVHSFNMEKLKIPRQYGASMSPEKVVNLTDRGSKNSKSLMNDLMMILSVESPIKVMTEVIQLKESHKACRKYRQFFKNVAAVVVEFAPPGFFSAEPTMNQVWKWITRLLEEYFKLKQNS